MRQRILSIGVWLGTSWTCFQVLKEHGYEGRWMPLQDIMKFSFPAPFSHRALFVVLADAIPGIEEEMPAGLEHPARFPIALHLAELALGHQ